MTIDKFNFAGKKAFVRVDFNVPLDENFNITDDTRIRAALPTLKKILSDGGSVIIGSHLGRPKGVADKFSLKHIVKQKRHSPRSVRCTKLRSASSYCRESFGVN